MKNNPLIRSPLLLTSNKKPSKELTIWQKKKTRPRHELESPSPQRRVAVALFLFDFFGVLKKKKKIRWVLLTPLFFVGWESFLRLGWNPEFFIFERIPSRTGFSGGGGFAFEWSSAKQPSGVTSAGDRWGEIPPNVNETWVLRQFLCFIYIYINIYIYIGWLPRGVGSTRNSCGDRIFGSTDLVVPTLVPLYTKKTARTSPCLFLRDSMMLDVDFFEANLFACVFLLFSAKCVFSFSTHMGLSLPVSPCHHVDALPICPVSSKSCKGSTGGFGRWPRRSGGKSAPWKNERWANDSPNDHLRLKFCWLPPKNRNGDSNKN